MAAGTIRLPRGCALDLGGIAKGMAVDAAVAELAERGVAAAVVEAGGDIAVTGLPPGAGAWPVVVEVRRGVREVAIASGALATSGISRRRWLRGGVEQHHLLDPRDGAPARNDLWSVTAAAATCAQAEVAAKVAFVLGREAGTRFLLRVGIPALLVRPRRTARSSSGRGGRPTRRAGGFATRRGGHPGRPGARSTARRRRPRMNIGSLTWDVARSGGMVAYALLTASVAIGLALSLRWRSPRWTRFVTNEVHRFVTLLSLVFVVVHGVAIAIDPFIKMSVPDVLVPFLTSYRPAWVALGIIAAYLALAIYLSERIRGRIGYAWWRRFHVLAFVAFGDGPRPRDRHGQRHAHRLGPRALRRQPRPRRVAGHPPPLPEPAGAHAPGRRHPHRGWPRPA